MRDSAVEFRAVSTGGVERAGQNPFQPKGFQNVRQLSSSTKSPPISHSRIHRTLFISFFSPFFFFFFFNFVVFPLLPGDEAGHNNVFSPQNRDFASLSVHHRLRSHSALADELRGRHSRSLPRQGDLLPDLWRQFRVEQCVDRRSCQRASCFFSSKKKKKD
jgi:hypothetical protein